MIFSPFLGAFHSFDSAILEKTTKRPEGGSERERASEVGRERGGPSPSSSSGLAERGRPRPRRPIMQNGPRLLKATLPFADDGGSTNGDNVNAFTLNGMHRVRFIRVARSIIQCNRPRTIQYETRYTVLGLHAPSKLRSCQSVSESVFNRPPSLPPSFPPR